jgi:replicative DNA helicase
MNSPNLDHEARIVALALDDAEHLSATLARGVKADHFTDPACRTIFATACDLLRARRPVAVETVASYLQDTGEIDRIGGFAMFTDRTRTPATSLCLGADLDRLRDSFALRIVADHSRAVLEIAEASNAGDLAGRLDQILPHLRAAQEAGAPTVARDLAHVAEAAAADLEVEGVLGLAGPFPSWDRVAGALRPGELCVLAARPGIGKTSLALQHVAAAMQAGKQAVVFSLEMTGEELCQRLARQRCGAAAGREVLARWIRKHLAGERHLQIYDGAAGASLAQIESRSRLHAAGPRGLALIVVDYLQLVAPPADLRRENRERQVATISRALKLLALELRTPLLLAAQLNRESEKEDRRPRLTDLRESGAIEQDADAVWFLHPDQAAGPQISDADRLAVVLSQAKRRSGPAGVGMKLSFHRPGVVFQAVASNAHAPEAEAVAADF